ncbi:MAG: xanthine dehydrogenase family protein subunit M [Chloroflexota bacterium]|nr:xanthine dehydrogenase family protein subunit M [Chloroflexota bacterium]
MKPAQFEYLAPATAEEAVQLLGDHVDDDAKLLAGGQSLVPLMNFRLARPKFLIDLNGIRSLSYIRDEGEYLAVGGLTRQRSIERSAAVAQCLPLLAEATRWIGHVAIRNRGTVGGSMAHNDPAAEYPLAAILLDAELVALGPSGQRTIPAGDFFITYLTTALQPDELLSEVRLPKLPASTAWSFQEFARRHGDFAIAAVGALLTLDGATIKEARIAVGGAAPVAFRAAEAEDMLKGETIADAPIEAAAEKAAAAAEPESDVHASAEYRAHLVKVLTRKALQEARTRATG